MKRLKPILLFAGLIILYACQLNRPYPAAMLQAMRCMEQHSDSALIYLTSLDSVIRNEPKETRMYYRLLKTKAEYKEYIRHDSDSLMKEVVRFYESYGDADKLMEAYYYLSTVYQDMQNVPQALAVCQQAAEAGKHSQQYLTLGRIYQDIGRLLAYQSLYEEALEVYQKSYEYFNIEENPGQVYAIRDIGRMHNELNRPDSAEHYYQAAYRKAFETNDPEIIEVISIELANVYLGWNKPDSTQKIFSRIPQLKDDAIYLQGLAEYHALLSQPDSAEFYYLQTLQAGKSNQNIWLKSTSNKALAELEARKGNYQAAFDYALKSLEIKDSIKTITRTETIGKIHAIYNYQHIEEANKVLSQKNKDKNTLLIIAIIIVIGICAWTYQYRKEQRRLIIEKEQRIADIKKEQEQNSLSRIKENEQKIAKLEKEIEQSQGEKEKLTQQIELLKKNNQKIRSIRDEKSLQEDSLKQSDIYLLFHKQAAQDEPKVSDEEWRELQKAIDQAYNDFTNRLYRLYPQISQHELRICYLIKVQIPVKEIAKILLRSASAISNSRVRLYKKLHGKEGKTEEFDRFVLDL